MSFDINPPRNNLSNVQASSKTTDGGGGNTGYFRRDGESEEEIIAFKEPKNDVFVKENEKNEEEESQSLLDIILNFFSDLIEAFKKIFTKKWLYKILYLFYNILIASLI